MQVATTSLERAKGLYDLISGEFESPSWRDVWLNPSQHAPQGL